MRIRRARAHPYLIYYVCVKEGQFKYITKMPFVF